MTVVEMLCFLAAAAAVAGVALEVIQYGLAKTLVRAGVWLTSCGYAVEFQKRQAREALERAEARLADIAHGEVAEAGDGV